MKYIARHEKLYIVGGCVRDMLMGREPKDVDYCFAGSEAELLALFPAATKVGVAFPVYLVEGCEVALTRTEESNGDGYGDFKVTGVGVSIEEDLNRRDFTMNQIAINTLTSDFVDPTGGREDILRKEVRTTNKYAFVEDPVRILRGLRFMATMGFTLDRYTNVIMAGAAPRLEHVTKERIVKELEKLWVGSNVPSEFFKNLKTIGALKYISPVLDQMTKVPAGPEKYHGTNTVFDHTMEVIDRIKANGGSFSAFIAGLTHDFGKVLTPAEILPHHYGHEYEGVELAKQFIAENRFDSYTNELIIVAMKNHMKAHKLKDMKAVKLVRFVKAVPKHMVADFRAVTAGDHPPTEDQAALFEKVFSTVNSVRLDADEIKRVNAATDKKQVVEQILTKHLSSALKG